MERNSVILSMRAFGVVIVVMLALGWAGQKDDEEYCFKVGYLDITASAPLFIAQQLGYFDEAGLCVETERFSTSNQLVAAIAASRLDYVAETSAAPALALELSSPGQFFVTAASTISEAEPFDAVLARSSSDITELSDLAGARIAVFPGTTAQKLLNAYLIEHGVDTTDTLFIPTPPPKWLTTLKSGAVDAAHVYEPEWTVGKSDPELKEIYGTIYGRQLTPNPQGISLLRRQVVEQVPRSAARLVSVFDRALTLMRESPKSARAVISAHFELPGDTVDRMHLLYMSPHNAIDWQSIEQYVELLIQVGELDGAPDVTSLRFAQND